MFNKMRFLVVGLSIFVFGIGCSQMRNRHATSSLADPGERKVRSSQVKATETVAKKSIEETDSVPERVSILQVGGQGESLPSPSDLDDESPTASSTPDSAVVTENSSLSLAELENLALQYNPTLSQAGAAIDSEWGVYHQSGLYPNPQFGYLNSTANQSAPKQSNGIFFSQEFVTSHKIPLAQQAASTDIKRLQWEQEAQRMRVLNDLRIRYYEVLGAKRALDVARRLEKLSTDNLSTAEELFRAKAVSRSDILQARVLLESSRIATAEATNRFDAAWGQITTMVGVPSLKAVQLVDDLAESIPDLDLETCWQQLLAESPQLHSSESELDHGRAELRVSQAQAIPNVTLQTVADYDRVTQSSTVSTLVALPVPFFNRNQGNVEKAIADIRADQAEICRVQLVLRDQLTDSFRRYKNSRVQAERLTQFVLPDTEENLRLTIQSYRAGEVSFRDVRAAQQSYAESQIAQIEALTEVWKVIVEIEGLQLTGGLNPAAIGSAIQSQPGGTGQRQRALLKGMQDQASKQLLPAAQIGK